MGWTPEAGWKSQGLLHLTVFIFGFTGILGKWISLDGVTLVWWRVFFAALCLAPFLFKKGLIPAQFWKMLTLSMGTGLVVGAHWATFFQAIKISNVSVTLASMSAATLFVAFLEPLFFPQPDWLDGALGWVGNRFRAGFNIGSGSTVWQRNYGRAFFSCTIGNFYHTESKIGTDRHLRHFYCMGRNVGCLAGNRIVFDMVGTVFHAYPAEWHRFIPDLCSRFYLYCIHLCSYP